MAQADAASASGIEALERDCRADEAMYAAKRGGRNRTGEG
jgi:PleD family two-component response regulator